MRDLPIPSSRDLNLLHKSLSFGCGLPAVLCWLRCSATPGWCEFNWNCRTYYKEIILLYMSTIKLNLTFCPFVILFSFLSCSYLFYNQCNHYFSSYNLFICKILLWIMCIFFWHCWALLVFDRRYTATTCLLELCRWQIELHQLGHWLGLEMH